ncbi:MAG: hypothetical protein GX661_06315 [Acholeplasmataceae bacterium]|nr:hypothetical protein [Acholeplasmataceae bacterium]
MKKCVRCGNMVPHDVKICDNCAFNFEEYEAYQKVFEVKEDPVVPNEQKSSLVDNPVITFIFGIISLVFMILVFFNPGVIILYVIGVFVFVVLTYIMAVKPSKVRLLPLQTVGRWMANIAFSITIFKIVYVLIGMIF